MSAEASTTAVALRRRVRASRARLAFRAALALAAAALAAAAVLWAGFAGSPARLPDGVHIAGVSVGGLTAPEAQRLLEARAARLAEVPVVFSGGTETWRLKPAQLGLKVDWGAAVEAAQREGRGFGPVRGLRRLQTRVFGLDIAPPTRVYDAALEYHVAAIARELRQRPREPRLELRGLRPVVVPGQAGRTLDRVAAEAVVVRSLAAFGRGPVGLPIRVRQPAVADEELAPVVAQVRLALSAPVRLSLGETRWRLPRWRVAELLALPREGTKSLSVGGPAAERWLDRLAARVDRPPRDARFEAAEDGTVAVVPSAAGVELDRASTARALLAAALSPTRRLAEVSVATAQPELTTARARALGITTRLATYSTAYAGTPDRIHNLRLAVSLLDGARVAPGETFSFNARVGERTAARGFRLAPVIVGGEYEDGVGGGVSQVATTVFNAAWEAGLKITARAPHALYIARYPLGRDATVNYPDLDLRFVNDTGRWLVVHAGAGDWGIWVSLYGAGTGRRVVSEPGPLVETGLPAERRVPDAAMLVGETAVEEEGEPSRSVSVKRTVYRRDGSVLYAETWTTTYRSETKVVRYGTKAPPDLPAPPKEEQPAPTTPPETAPAPTTPTVTTTAPTVAETTPRP